MARFVVCGGGPIGLASAMLLARDGHEVTVLESDPQLPPGAVEAWTDWDRKGVAQFRQPHNLFPGLQRILDTDLPDVAAALVDAGCSEFNPLTLMPPSLSDQDPRPGDERFRCFTGRRPVVEAVFAHAADREPGVDVRRGVKAVGLQFDSATTPVRVTGVRTSAGETLAADVVIDAMGRKSPTVDWLADVGLTVEVQKHDIGFAYYTRFFRGPAVPPRIGPPLAPLGSISVLTLPGDNDTWSVTVIGTSADRPLKEVRHADKFAAVLSKCPLQAHWLDGDPITDVLPMSGVVDKRQRFVPDGKPVVAGLLAVGDAWACTNPTGGRGLSVGMVHAQALRDTIRTHGISDLVALAVAWEEASERKAAPYVEEQQQVDARRLAEMVAHRDGTDVPPPDPKAQRVAAAFMTDPEVFRAVLAATMCLSVMKDELARPEIAERIAACAAPPPPPIPGPDRAELLALLA